MAKKPAKTLDLIDGSIKRWQSRLQRAMTMLKKLEKQRKRIEAAATKPSRPRAPVPPLTEGMVRKGGHNQGPSQITERPAAPAPITKSAEIDTEIPAFLRREKAADDLAAVEIVREQEETKKKKARGRIEKMKAKQRGDLKKMPLTGKAALEAIRNG